MKVLFLNADNLDFESNGDRIKGTSLKYVEMRPPKDENSKTTYVPGKQWIKSEESDLVNIANTLIPGQIIELDYSLEGKKVVFSGIKPGELAVDFDSIFVRKE